VKKVFDAYFVVLSNSYMEGLRRSTKTCFRLVRLRTEIWIQNLLYTKQECSALDGDVW